MQKLVEMNKKRFNDISSTFTNKSILVVGDIMLDSFMWGVAERISPEAPVPIVAVDTVTHSPGGAGNVACNLSKLSAKIRIIGLVGNDAESEILADKLQDAGVDTNSMIKDTTRPTTVKIRVIAHNQHVIRTDHENTGNIQEDKLEEIGSILDNVLSKTDGIIIEDYNKGLLTPDSIALILAKAAAHDIPVYVDPKKENFFAYQGVRLFKPNMSEFESALSGENDYKDFKNSGTELRKKLGTEILMVTQGERGISLFSDQGMHTIGTKARKVHDVSGAGDTAISAFVLADLAGATIEEAAQISNYAAGRVCEEVGVVPITLEMLDEIVEHYNDH